MYIPIEINTKNLNTATAQEVFDWIVYNIIKQGRKSIRKTRGGHSCRYRGNGGCRCSAGWLISDDVYNDTLEGRTWGFLVESGRAPITHTELIASLQYAHDMTSEHEFINEFIGFATSVADRHKLTRAHIEEWRAGTI